MDYPRAPAAPMSELSLATAHFCRGCDRYLPLAAFQMSALKDGRHACASCERARGRRQRAAQDLAARLAGALYHAAKRRGAARWASAAEVRSLLAATGGRSAFSEAPASALVLMNPAADPVCSNLVPVSATERRALGRRTQALLPVPSAVRSRLDAVYGSARPGAPAPIPV